jgi:uncharacterized protein involved in exopolysaccharide biosynthesis
MELIYDRLSGMLTVAYTHIDPVFAKDIVNRSVELLQEWFMVRGGSTKQHQKVLLEAKLDEVSDEINNLENQIQDFQEKYGVLRVEELATVQTERLGTLRAQLEQKNIEIRTYSQFSLIEDPTIIKLRTERDSIIRQIQEIENGSEAQNASMPASKDLPEIARYFNKLSSDLEIQKRIYQSLSQQYEILKLNLEGEAVFQILELAEVPDEKAGPQRTQIILIVTMLALIGSSVCVFIMNSVKRVRGNYGKNVFSQ